MALLASPPSAWGPRLPDSVPYYHRSCLPASLRAVKAGAARTSRFRDRKLRLTEAELPVSGHNQAKGQKTQAQVRQTLLKKPVKLGCGEVLPQQGKNQTSALQHPREELGTARRSGVVVKSTSCFCRGPSIPMVANNRLYPQFPGTLMPSGFLNTRHIHCTHIHMQAKHSYA